MCKILDQYADKIKGIFSFFDRMIMNGYILPLTSEYSRSGALYQLGILYKDFKTYFMNITESIKSHIEHSAFELGRPVIYLSSAKHSKEDAAWVQYPVRFQCANDVKAFFDKNVHDAAACIPAVAKKIGNHWRYRQLICNLLHDFYLRLRLVVHDDGIIKDNAIAGEHDGNSLMSIVLLSLEVGLVEIRIFNRMQSP